MWRELIDEVMFEIRELSGQQYRNTYATKRSENLVTPTAVVGSDAVDPAEEGSSSHVRGANSHELESSTP